MTSSYFFIKKKQNLLLVLNRSSLDETLLMVYTHNICFYGEFGKLIPEPLNCQSQQLLSALSSASDFESHFCKQCGPRSDCSSRIWFILFACMQK